MAFSRVEPHWLVEGQVEQVVAQRVAPAAVQVVGSGVLLRAAVDQLPVVLDGRTTPV
jgi:hypothetical protein